MALEYITYLCAPYIWVIHLHHAWLLAFIFIILQLALGLTSDPVVPASDVEFWAWKTLTGLAGLLVGALVVHALRAPCLLSFDDRFDPLHVVWVVFQLAIWHAILLFPELVATPWGGFAAVILFGVFASVCCHINKQRANIFKYPRFADIVYFWLAAVLILFMVTWSVATWAGLQGLYAVIIAVALWVPIFLYMLLCLKPYIECTWCTPSCGDPCHTRGSGL